VESAENLDAGRARWQFGRMADSGLNPTAAALLGLLHEGPMTGGQLMAAAGRRLGPYWSMTRSQVYRELPALAEAGFVKLGKLGARSSQPYAITPAGKRAFIRWLAEPPAREVLRSPLALRVAFGGHQSPAQLQQVYAQATEYHNSAHNEAREQAKEAAGAGDEFAAAALELAAAYHKAALAWLKSAPGK
jgi:DNA-binding PadR family transcriptional regulator